MDSEAIASTMLIAFVAVSKQIVLILCSDALIAAIVTNSKKIALIAEEFFALRDTFSCAGAPGHFCAVRAEICLLLR